MIKVLTHRSQRNSLPAFGAVAGLTGLREASVVRIGVAIRTLGKGYAGVARFPFGARCVALFALHLQVRPGQRIARFGVIELSYVGRLPVGVVVALDTIRAQTSLVRILMAGNAGLRYTQKAARQVLHPDRGALGGGNVIGTMAASARHTCMLAFENVAGEFVIEGFGIPLDERKILTVVFRVTARALLARSWGNVVGGVEALVRGDAGCNFSVAVDALQRGSGAERMTCGTVGCAGKRLVRARKRARRNLRPSRRQEPQQTKCRQGLEQTSRQSL